MRRNLLSLKDALDASVQQLFSSLFVPGARIMLMVVCVRALFWTTECDFLRLIALKLIPVRGYDMSNHFD